MRTFDLVGDDLSLAHATGAGNVFEPILAA
jgi:hypothetical protein